MEYRNFTELSKFMYVLCFQRVLILLVQINSLTR